MVNGNLAELEYLPDTVPLRKNDDRGVRRVAKWMNDYFSSPRQVRGGLPLVPGGTPFQRRVWQALQAIPCGQTLSYGELAQRLGSGARAVAAACRSNPIPLVIPCHRVVAATGPGGYMGKTAGAALAIKQWLIDHESSD